MASQIAPLTETPAWKALGAHYEKIRNTHLSDLFADDPTPRGNISRSNKSGSTSTTRSIASREETISCCCNSPSNRGLRERIDAMFRGDHINVTENRAVLHVALRAPRGDQDHASMA